LLSNVLAFSIITTGIKGTGKIIATVHCRSDAFTALTGILFGTGFLVITGSTVRIEDTSDERVAHIISTGIPIITDEGLIGDTCPPCASILQRTDIPIITGVGMVFMDTTSFGIARIGSTRVGIVTIEGGPFTCSIQTQVIHRTRLTIIANKSHIFP